MDPKVIANYDISLQQLKLKIFLLNLNEKRYLIEIVEKRENISLTY